MLRLSFYINYAALHADGGAGAPRAPPLAMPLSVGLTCALTNAWLRFFCRRGMNLGCGAYFLTL